MPIIDSRYGIYIEDPKPVKVCQWTDCPDATVEYRDSKTKMKMCARCNVVRYCSKKCQRSDWPEHKLYFQIPPIMDIGEWMTWLNIALFRWTLIEALNLRTEPSNILKYGLWVQITRMDRLVKGIAPSPFVVESTSVLSFDHMNELTESDACTPRGSRDIIKAGGVGQGLVIFNADPPKGRSGYTIWRVQHHDILELPPAKSERPGKTLSRQSYTERYPCRDSSRPRRCSIHLSV
ncbi:hypothetical protein DFH07DRAFT_927907 [Mycena maculata]|uniref:MYND-type domain-containing protein n=1 Tax=Mycena maculata TaxID=230809 RepID=A0AAD7I7V5_9AGAR|nr:hypothetical protein DFH07DRAFT_927907 [Mycena maculata]